MPLVHPTAVIDPSALIADSVVIGPYCVVGAHSEIGEGTVLHNHAVVGNWTRIGRENCIHSFAVVGGEPQDKKYHGEETRCEVGDRNHIREHATIHRGTANGGAVTRVGNDTLVMVGAHIAHDCLVGSHVILANQVMLAGHIHVEDGANIGGGTGVHHFATIGSCAMVGGLARVTHDVPPFMIVEGSPAKVRGHNHVAMARSGFSESHIEAVKDAYKRLFRDNGAPMVDKLPALCAEYPDVPAISRLCEALRASACGVHGRARETHRKDNKRAVRA